MPRDRLNVHQSPILTCSVMLTATHDHRPPLLLIHGSANAATVWTLWQQALVTHGWSSYALDLRGHGHNPTVDLSRVSMADYADDVHTLVRQLRQPPILVGWSMGGLIAMMVAATGGIKACIALAPSLPAQHVDTSVSLRTGLMTAEVYGITSHDPAEQPAMPDLTLAERRIALDSCGLESLYARDDRQRGIIIDALPCPLLLVTGTADTLWPSARYESLWLPATRLQMDGASHWGLVLNGRALTTHIPQIIAWLEQTIGGQQ